MAFTNPKPLGYGVGERLPSADVNSVWSDIEDAIDGAGGGTYTPAAAITIAGANGLVCTGPLTCSGVTTIAAPTISGAADITGSAVVSGNLTTSGSGIIDIPGTASYVVSGSNVIAGNRLTLTESINNNSFSLSSNAVTVPSSGVYLMCLSMAVTIPDLTNPASGRILIISGGATAIGRATGYRFSATASNPFSISLATPVTITTPGSEAIELQSDVGGTGLTVVANTSVSAIFTLTRLGPTP